MKINKLDHVSISTDQLEDTKKFYCDLLGLKVGHRPKLKSSGYWLYSGEEAIIHLVETGSNLDQEFAFSDDKKTARSLGNPKINDLSETGMDDHIAMTVEESAGLVNFMKVNKIVYWDRLLVDRELYQVFVRDPNGVIIELNDYKPEADKIDPIAVIDHYRQTQSVPSGG